MFRQLATTEVHLIRSRPGGAPYGNPDWSLRGALVLKLQHMATGIEFQVATIHLKCCNEPLVRKHQAALLAKELMATGLPTILLGDSNIPIEPGEDGPTSSADKDAFTSLTVGSQLVWVKPSNPVKTQCHPELNSMLDQLFGPVSMATATAEIKFLEASYCDRDSEGYSDHRPLVGRFPDFLTGQPTGASLESQARRAGISEGDLENAEYLAQKERRPDDSVAR
jgi:endonuclease/exonuclease/phosphatase family metal-dependent hydrolase